MDLFAAWWTAYVASIDRQLATPMPIPYFITEGQIHWAAQWSDAEIASGRRAEEQRRQAYYESKDRERRFWVRLWKLVRNLFGK
jgi:hypothetical protein